MEKPQTIAFQFSDGFEEYQLCYYNMDQFGQVAISLGAFKNAVELMANQYYAIGCMPVGFRPIAQIHWIGTCGSTGATIGAFMTSDGVVKIFTRETIPENTSLSLQLIYRAYN